MSMFAEDRSHSHEPESHQESQGAALSSEINSIPQLEVDTQSVLAEARVFSPLEVFPDYVLQFPDEIRCLEIGGVHPLKDYFTHNPYNGEELNRSFRNLGEHNLGVGLAADILSSALVEAGFMSGEEARSATAAALIHDSTKGLEILRSEAGVEDAYSREAYQRSSEFLREHPQADEELIQRMMEAGSEWDEDRVVEMLQIDPQGEVSLVPFNLERKILMLSDDVLSTRRPDQGQEPGSLFVAADERIEIGKWRELYKHFVERGFGVDSNGEIVVVEDIQSPAEDLTVLGSYLEIRRFIDTAICLELRELLDSDSTEHPQLFVKRILNEGLGREPQST